MIKVFFNDVIANASNLKILTAGMVRGRTVEFTFSADWNSLNKTAVFTNGIDTRKVPEYKWGEFNTVDIPPEILSTPHHFVKCGVYGTDDKGELVIPSLWAELGNVFPSASPSEYKESEPPTPNTWDDLQNQIGNLKSLNTEYKYNLVGALNEVLEKAGNADILQDVEESLDVIIAQQESILEEQDRIIAIQNALIGGTAK